MRAQFFRPQSPTRIAQRIKNAAHVRGNEELAGQLRRQLQSAGGAPNYSIRPDRFFSFCPVRIFG